MKVTLKQAVDSIQGLREIMLVKMPLATAMQLDKIITVCDEEIQRFQKLNQEKYKELGEQIEGEKEGTLRIKAENIDQYVSETNAILATEIDLPGEKINSQDLKNIELSPIGFRQLKDWLIA